MLASLPFTDSSRCSYASSVGLWQLRDQSPLSTWVKGRVILIGDAAHAMLPRTPHPLRAESCSHRHSAADQGQGAGQSIEDAEALEALLTGAGVGDVAARLALIETVRKERASTIQAYSRQKALGSQDGKIFTLKSVPHCMGVPRRALTSSSTARLNSRRTTFPTREPSRGRTK